jgi:hypothetical protein
MDKREVMQQFDSGGQRCGQFWVSTCGHAAKESQVWANPLSLNRQANIVRGWFPRGFDPPKMETGHPGHHRRIAFEVHY